jgi:glycosyltransferase involved in cell wall biosynthesis
MFILEALARDNCVVSTEVGGIPNVLGQGRGLVVPPGDIDAFATALQAAMTQTEMRHRVAFAGRQAFDAEYSAQSVYPRVEQLWRDVLNHPSP